MYRFLIFAHVSPFAMHSVSSSSGSRTYLTVLNALQAATPKAHAIHDFPAPEAPVIMRFLAASTHVQFDSSITLARSSARSGS